LIAALMMLAAAARGGSTVNVNPGTITQTSLDAAGVNGTIRFVAAGQYQCAAQLKPLAGQSFVGTGKISAAPYLDTTTVPGFSIPSFKLLYSGPEVVAPAGFYAFKISTAGVSFSNVAFRDNAIWLEGTAAQTKGLKIDQCWFSAFAPMGGDYNNSIYLNHNQDVRITDCAFNDPANKFDHFIFSYSAANYFAGYSSFDGAGDGIHIADFGGATTGSVKECLFTHQKRMAVEYQGGGKNFKVEDCWQQDSIFLADPRPHATPGNPNDNNLGYSLPSDASTGTTATGNVTIGPPAQPQAGVMHKQYFGYEFSGQDWRCNGNLIVNVEWPVAVTNKAAWGTAANNHIEQCGAFDVSIPALKKQLLERGRPGPMHRLGAAAPPPPALVVTAAVDMSQPKAGTYTLSFVNPPAGVRAVRIHNRAKESSGLADVETVGIARNFDYASSITYSGGHPGWVQQARAEFFDAGGQLLGASEWITLDRFPGSPTDPFPPTTQPATRPADDPIVKVESVGGYKLTHQSGKVETAP
jgi:hypothetical protein